MNLKLKEYYSSNTPILKTYQAILGDVFVMILQISALVKNLHTSFLWCNIIITAVMSILFLVAVCIAVYFRADQKIVANVFIVYCLVGFAILAYYTSGFQWYYIVTAVVACFLLILFLTERTKRKILRNEFKKGIAPAWIVGSTSCGAGVFAVLLHHIDLDVGIMMMLGSIILSLLAFFELIMLVNQIIVCVSYKEDN